MPVFPVRGRSEISPCIDQVVQLRRRPHFHIADIGRNIFGRVPIFRRTSAIDEHAIINADDFSCKLFLDDLDCSLRFLLVIQPVKLALLRLHIDKSLTVCKFIQGIPHAAICSGIFAVLRRRFERLLQKPLRCLRLLFCLAGQFAHDLADGVAKLLQHRAVLAVPADKLAQHVRVGDHLARVVRCCLVHRLIHADCNAHAVVALVQDVRGLRHVAVLHDGAAERRVLLGGKLLHPVRPLMADDLHHRVLRVLCNANFIALNNAVSRAAAHLIRHAHAHAEGLCHGVDLVCRRVIHFT